MTYSAFSRVRMVGFALSLATFACAHTLSAQTPPPRDTVVKIEALKVTAERGDEIRVAPLQGLTLPAASHITSAEIQRTINVIDVEDAVKYLPSLFIRKRNNGDTQATVGSRVWGVSSSARTLVLADGVPLSALVANNNTIGGPRWGVVSPIEIARIDVMHGPFSAAYAGNSIGAVMAITTRMPEKLEGTISQTYARQRFSLYGTRGSFGTTQTNVDVGNRLGKASFWLSGNYQVSHSQPLALVTSASFPSGTSGGYEEQNKLGAAANVLGANGLLHTRMTNGKLKLAYDVAPRVRVAYTLGYWKNDATAVAESYLDRDGTPTYAGQSGFASGTSLADQQHLFHSVSVRTDTPLADWNVEASATTYRFGVDRLRTPSSASSADTTFGSAGRIANLDGTGWSTADLKLAWHRGGIITPHVVTFGAHYDRYVLRNPTYATAEWREGDPSAVVTEGDGKTSAVALWAQDAWTISPTVTATIGARYERWRGFDGYNANGITQVAQPEVSATRLSPKAIVAWMPAEHWTVTASAAKAYRFATAAELYQLISTGSTFTSPDPNLEPDDDLATELRVVRQTRRGTAQLSFFQDDLHDAIISQFLPLVPGSTTLYSYAANVDHVRARGVELAVNRTDVLTSGLDLSGSATFLDAHTLALSGRASATAPEGSAVGKALPNIPKWRGSATASYRRDKWVTTLGARYSDKLYTTLDNADVHPNTYQGFAEWFVADARVRYRPTAHWAAAVGVDNLLDRKYFLFHPFPQRTMVFNLTYER